MALSLTHLDLLNRPDFSRVVMSEGLSVPTSSTLLCTAVDVHTRRLHSPTRFGAINDSFLLLLIFRPEGAMY